MASELTVPRVDFSPLGDIPDIYRKNQADAIRQQTLASLGQGGAADARALLKSGDLSLAQLGMTLQQREAEAARNAQLDARQLGRDSVSDAHQKFMEGIALRGANRADEGPVEEAGYRAQVAATYGLEKGTPEYKTFVLTNKLPDSVANGGSPEVGLQPAYGTGPDGKVGAIQFSKTGKAVQTQLPEGFSLSKEPMKVDMGTHIQLIDPITRQSIGAPISKNLAGVEREKAVGEATGAAELALPTVLANSQQVLKTLDGIDKHPGKQYSLGLYSKVPTIPGTPQADFRANVDQLSGQVFLQAYEALKRGGAITDIEGAKGSNAIARLQTSQSEASFNTALKDFRDVVKAGAERAAAKARGAGSPNQAPAAPNTADPLGIR